MRAEQDFQSLSRGVFVIPFKPDKSNEAGPSKPKRPLKRYYDEAYERYQRAYDDYEQNRVTDQIQEVTDWLRRCASPPWIPIGGGAYRVPLGIIQNAAPALEARLDASLVARHVVTLNGRDVADVVGGIRAIALGLVTPAIAGARTGKSGLDQVEEWYGDLKESDRGPILVQITSAQLVPLEIMSELLYVLALHPELPIHVLLSVPSTAVFLDTLTFVEPASVDMAILGAGKTRGGGAVGAILRVGSGTIQHYGEGNFSSKADNDLTKGLHLGDDLRDKLYRDEEMLGSGPQAALKAIKWALLHHSATSPLTALAAKDMQRAEAVVEGRVPGAEDLTVVDVNDDMVATLDPAPRISILHALSHPSAYTDPNVDRARTFASRAAAAAVTPRKRGKQIIESVDLSENTPRNAKRRKEASGTPGASPAQIPAALPLSDPEPVGQMADRGDLRVLEVMFNLYRAAGRNINLWDWLEGFRAGMRPARDSALDVGGGDHGAGTGVTESSDRKADDPQMDEETSARLHAAFVRFCEEARMMGLMRARGNARRKGVDEVVKSIGLF